MRSVDPHAIWRALISDRIDSSLSLADEEALRVHLAGCPRCRMVERGYLRARQMLRALPQIPVPRDLWARTVAALDVEVARQPRHSRRHRDDLPPHPSRSPALMLVAMASLVVAIVAMSSRLAIPESIIIPPPNDPEAVLPTPFQVPTQELALVDFTAEGLTIYETTVDQACPPVALDCTAIQPHARRQLTFDGDRFAASLDMDPPNGRLAVLTTDDDGRETVAVVLLPLYERQPPDTGTGGPASPVPTATLVETPRGSTYPTATSPEGDPTIDPPGRTPRATRAPTDGPGGTRGPSDVPTRHDPGDPTVPRSVGGPDLTTAGESPGGEGSGYPSESPLPTPAEVAVSAILEDVHVVGAPPAWSSDGSVLAFSAMPADRSRGPDVYTWHVGDGDAQRLTRDHGSYFASWSGSRVVIGRVAFGVDRSTLIPESAVMDPVSGEQRAVKSAAQWLPVVDPTGSFAVSWFGALERSERQVSASEGELYLVDWRAIDPFREPDASPVAEATDTGGSSPGPSSTAGPDADPTSDAQEGSEHRPAESGADPHATLTAERTEAAAREEASASEQETSKLETGQEVLIPSAGQALEPARDPRLEPVLDWQVRWSDDGTAFGFWVSEGIGDSWGRLTVLRVRGETGQIDPNGALLLPTLARRAFSLGLDRVAWVGPSDDGPDGELRLRTWGGGGSGGLRIRQMDLRNGLPAF